MAELALRERRILNEPLHIPRQEREQCPSRVQVHNCSFVYDTTLSLALGALFFLYFELLINLFY